MTQACHVPPPHTADQSMCRHTQQLCDENIYFTYFKINIKLIH